MSLISRSRRMERPRSTTSGTCRRSAAPLPAPPATPGCLPLGPLLVGCWPQPAGLGAGRTPPRGRECLWAVAPEADLAVVGERGRLPANTGQVSGWLDIVVNLSLSKFQAIPREKREPPTAPRGKGSGFRVGKGKRDVPMGWTWGALSCPGRCQWPWRARPRGWKSLREALSAWESKREGE